MADTPAVVTSRRGTILKVIGVIILIVVFGPVFIGGSFYTVDQGERGVILRNGAVVGTAEPGLGFKLPVIDKVVKITVQNRAQVYDKVNTYSRDQQPADITLSVSYHLPADQVAKIYAEYGGESGIVNRLIDRRVYRI